MVKPKRYILRGVGIGQTHTNTHFYFWCIKPENNLSGFVIMPFLDIQSKAMTSWQCKRFRTKLMFSPQTYVVLLSVRLQSSSCIKNKRSLTKD